MTEFPTNSHKQTNYTAQDKAVPEPKKIEKVVDGKVLRRKKPWTRRLLDNFVGGDLQTVQSYVFMEVLLPAAKDAIADAFSQGIERMLFGESRSSSRRSGARQGTYSGYVNYNRIGPSTRPPAPNRRDDSRRRSRPEFDDIILATRIEAEEVIDRLFDLISRYESASVADLYELIGATGNYTDDKRGWTDIRGSGVRRVTGGYLLNLPRPEPIE